MILYGAAYYPEHWPEERWPTDADMMAQCGFNTVRVGEFAWSRFEPKPGQFDFAWLNRAMGHLDTKGIKAVMGTPTGGVPPWFTAKYPESLIIKSQGQKAGWGNRYFTCYNHQPFLDASLRIVEAQATYFAKNPRVLGWHLHNEMGNSPCFCERCRAGLQGWLKSKYKTLDELNRRWGTIFWSQVYTDWKEIPVPINTHNPSAPALELDWQRYYISLVRDYAAAQAAVIRRLDPGKWISTNLDPDDLAVFDVLDRTGFNFYPHTWDNHDDLSNSYHLDGMRAPGKKLNPISFEQRGGQPGWDLVSRLNRPGELNLLAWQAFAHGADGATFFRWRIGQFGHENLWGGIVRHDGSYHPQVFPDVKQLGEQLKKIGPLMEGSRVESQFAILRSQDSAWALSRQPQQERLSYDGQCKEYYRAAARAGLNIDVIDSSGDFSGYKVLAMPMHYVMTKAIAAKLEAFVATGGVLLGGFRSAVVNEDVTMPGEEAPIFLRKLFGMQVEAYDVQEIERYRTNPNDPAGSIRMGAKKLVAHSWYDLLKLGNAEALARYDADFYKGTPAISRNRHGKGWAIYVGCAGEAGLYDAVLKVALRLAKLKPLMKLPEGVEVRERTGSQGTLRFLLNFSKTKKRVSLGKGFSDLLKGGAAPASFTLGSYGAAALLSHEKLSNS